MKIRILGLLFLLLIALSLNQSCAKRNKSRSSKVSLSRSCTTGVNPESLGLEGGPPEIGALPTPNLSLADLTIPESAVEVLNQSASPNTPVVAINVNYDKIHPDDDEREMTNTFPVWNICTLDGKTCLNNGAFKISKDFFIQDITDLPKGVLTVKVKLCVNDLKFLSAADQNATNDCTSESPCYCGTLYKTQYMNSNDSSLLDPALAAQIKVVQDENQKLFNIAHDYIKQAQNYVNTCSSDSNTAQLEYAQNIASSTPANLSLYTQEYGDYLKAFLAEEGEASQSLNLANTCPTEETGEGLELAETNPDAPTGLPGSSTTDSATVSTDFTTTSSASSSDSGSGSGSSTGGIVALGIGVPMILIGAVVMANYGMKLSGGAGLRSRFLGPTMDSVKKSINLNRTGNAANTAASTTAAASSGMAAVRSAAQSVKIAYEGLKTMVQVLNKKIQVAKVKYENELVKRKDAKTAKKLEKLETKLDNLPDNDENEAKRAALKSKEKILESKKTKLEQKMKTNNDTIAKKKQGITDLKESYKTRKADMKAKQKALKTKGSMKGIGGFIGGLLVAGVGIGATIYGATSMSLADTSESSGCGNFTSIIQSMESQMYDQAQVIESANDRLEDLRLEAIEKTLVEN